MKGFKNEHKQKREDKELTQTELRTVLEVERRRRWAKPHSCLEGRSWMKKRSWNGGQKHGRDRIFRKWLRKLKALGSLKAYLSSGQHLKGTEEIVIPGRTEPAEGHGSWLGLHWARGGVHFLKVNLPSHGCPPDSPQTCPSWLTLKERDLCPPGDRFLLYSSHRIPGQQGKSVSSRFSMRLCLKR